MAETKAFTVGETKASNAFGHPIQGHEILQFAYRNHHEDTVNAGHHVIHTGGPYDSHLLVPVIPAK